MPAPWKESYDKPRWHIEKQRYHFASKAPYSQSYEFSSSHVYMWVLDHSHVWMWELNCDEDWVLKKTLESSINWKEIKPVNPKGSQFWIFIGRTNAEAEAPILCLYDAKSWLIDKSWLTDTGEDWRQKEKGLAENVMDR